LITPLIIVCVALLGATLPYVFVESRWRWRWREIEVGRVAADGQGGIYRAGGEVPRFWSRAPTLVRVAAFSCFLFGQMFLPGLVLGVFGMVMAGIGLVSIPGLITAAKIYRAGFALLRREPRTAYFRARDAAAWALWLNVILMSGSLVALATGRHSTVAVVAVVDGYGALSIVQALLLKRVTRVYEDALFAGSAHPCA
jgi:hypothetical protein